MPFKIAENIQKYLSCTLTSQVIRTSWVSALQRLVLLNISNLC